MYLFSIRTYSNNTDGRSRLAATTVALPSSEGVYEENHRDVIPLLCSIFLMNQGAGDASGEGNTVAWVSNSAM